MKQNLFQLVLTASLTAGLMLSSCTRSGQDIYTIVPDNAAVVGSFSPGNIMKKAAAQDIEYIRNSMSSNGFNKALFENPSISGIDFDAHSAFFVFGSTEKYLGIIMPVKKQKDLESFLEKVSEEYNLEFKKEKGDKFSYTRISNSVIAWNKSVLLNLTLINGWDETPIETKIATLFALEAEQCILSDKDFKSFLTEQKDLNIWATSNQIESLTGTNMGMLNILGAINNNYAHISLDFQDGAVVLSTNLSLNPDFKKNFDKFNIIDQNAEKNILKMLPSENLLLAGNFRINPSKMLEILKSFNSGDNQFMEEFEKETGKTPGDVINALQGSLAFSINGITKGGKNNKEDAEEFPENERIPVMVAAMQINDEELFTNFIDLIKKEEPISEKKGYYVIPSEGSPFYLGVKDKVILLSNEEKYISEIVSTGGLKNNLLSLDISKKLIDNPICVFMNLDKSSYSDDVNDYLQKEMDARLAMGLEGLGKSLKSLTLIGNIEKTEIRIEMKDKSVNSLHLILKSMEL